MARLAFFGTPEFAVPSLEALLESEHEVVALVCQADRKKGRGHKMTPPPTKVAAQSAGVPNILQPLTLKKGTDDGDAFWDAFTAMNIDLGIVAAYGRILSTRLLTHPPRGFVNVHASLLPRWRGAAPIHRAIEAGDTKTGVCLMDMVFALDAGDVYAEAECAIHPSDNSETLTPKVANLGKELLARHLDAILAGSLEKTPQPESGVTYAEMLKKNEAVVDFGRTTADIVNHVRAMVPWPGSQTTIDDTVLKLFDASAIEPDRWEPPGTVLRADDALVVSTRDGAVAFASIQFPGKKRMAVADVVRGHPIAAGTRLGHHSDED